ncbi:glycoside hydrolase superfamily [Hypoxylon trugodes]|uniref:glycoside hydrolase superfamily n=1 Tax=Hypoxylon trugodes TaxID=326681 RepID=UPI002191175D|nr:glycoside hydrolase superfamily [Hypoxylon trugodes]KAI1392303.1 glycoside hydrolase superfamily [Hypoxylon trugodes]
MQLKHSVLVAAAVSASTVAATTYTKDYKLNAYWGQSGPDTDFLGDHCENDNIDYVTVGFVNNSPENGNGTGYPGTNFAAHCAAEVYSNNNRKSKLLSSCSYIKDDIQKCQRLGKKVLLSVGGEFSATSNYTLSTVQAGIDFAEFLYQAFGPYKSSYHGPRPFDPSSTSHTTIDGFDFDIETKFANQQPYVNMVNHLRTLIQNDRKSIILTAAPQCPQSDQYFQMKTILQQAKFDKIWVQFYNNPSCEAAGTGFNYNDWSDFIDGGVNSAAELYIGLPGSLEAVGLLGSGYISPSAAKSLICSYKNKKHFGGAMLWDAYYASENQNLAGKKYSDSIAEALKCGGCSGDVCAPPTSTSSVVTSTSTTSSSTSSTISTTSTSSSTSSTVSTTSTSSSASSTVTSTSSSASTSSYVATTSSSTSSSSSSSAATSSSASTSSSADPSNSSNTVTSASSSYIATSSSSSFDPNETCTDSTTSSVATSTSSASATTTQSSSSSVSTSSSTISSLTTTSSSYSASTTASSTSSEEDDCPPDETSSSSTQSATLSVSATTTASQSNYPTITGTSSSYPTASVSSSSSSASVTSLSYPVNNSSTTSYTTSTVYTTSVYTVTSCAASVTDCPARGSVVTKTIALYTTVCPVTATQTGVQTQAYQTQSPKPTGGAGVTTTSTVYSTRVSTITKCPASVTNCPVGSVTSETVPVTTVVITHPAVFESNTYPAASPVPTTATYPAGSNENGSSPSKPVQIVAVSSYPVAGASSAYIATTLTTAAIYPTGGYSSGGNTNSTVPTYSAGTGYPVAPTTTLPGYSAVACNGNDCTAAYPTASIVTAGSAKTASLSLGLLAVVAFLL